MSLFLCPRYKRVICDDHLGCNKLDQLRSLNETIIYSAVGFAHYLTLDTNKHTNVTIKQYMMFVGNI